MPEPYSQSKALWAITRSSFTAIFAQPIAIVFSLMFPVIFILIFGAFGDRNVPSFRVSIDPSSDTSNGFYTALKAHPALRFATYTDTASLNRDLIKGNLVAVIKVKELKDSSQHSRFMVDVRSTTANDNSIGSLMQALDYFRLKFESSVKADKAELIHIEQPVITEGKKYKQIDFVLPGQIGFSILFATLFGIAFTFYTLREQLVLKRFYASPINRINILVGIGVSRLFFQLLNVVVLILFGHFMFGFRLEYGVFTIIEMVVLAMIMLFLLMGVGLIFSSVAKSDTSIPILINLFGFPQMLLSGTFFSIQVFPKWLQTFCNILPLTQFNNATRKISFDGLHLTDVWKEIGIMGIWIAAVYILLSRVIKWE